MIKRNTGRQLLPLLAMILLVALALSACSLMGGTGATVGIPEVAITKTDGGYEIAAEVPSGVVAFTAPAETTAFPVRLNEGVTLDRLNAALADPDPTLALSLVSMLGGSAEASDGHPLVSELKPGAYALLDLPEDGAPAIYPFTAAEASGAAAPTPDVTVDLVDFSFAVPAEVKSGPQVWQINNKGQQWHEMGILKLAEGTTVDDVLAMLQSDEQSGPPPFEAVAFWGPISAGETGYVTWDLPPGEYTLICFLPDLTGDMNPHAAHGMVSTLTVTE